MDNNYNWFETIRPRLEVQGSDLNSAISRLPAVEWAARRALEDTAQAAEITQLQTAFFKYRHIGESTGGASAIAVGALGLLFGPGGWTAGTATVCVAGLTAKSLSDKGTELADAAVDIAIAEVNAARKLRLAGLPAAD